MNSHALVVLEFERVLDVVAGRASSAPGSAAVRALRPTDDREWIEREQTRVAAMRALVASDARWSTEPVPDAEQALSRLRAAGSTWSGAELWLGYVLLRSSRLTRSSLGDERHPAAARALLAPLRERLVSSPERETAVERALDPDGSVRDDASPLLRRVRRELRGAESDLVNLLEREMTRLATNHRVLDMSVTMRNGRYVIPVRREGRGSLGGIVHDESATGQTLFVEPPAAVEFGTRIRGLEAEAQREVDRILRELTDSVRPLHADMVDSLAALIELDSLYARARFAGEFSCEPVVLVTPGEPFSISYGRHPLLASSREPVVPFDLAMDREERTLLLSGPNTGGKTVLLKALGLVSAMVQAGIPPLVGPGSSAPVYDDFFADIGDEQSIQASLSTFSAHLRNLGEILGNATARSLVLIDELGSGTDPAEGAALGGAILEELAGRGSRTVATTHLGELKLLATETPSIVNASLQFDERALAPTYRLIKGIPGRSYGISIARRLRLPEEVLTRAEERLPEGTRDLAALLADLEHREAALSTREERAERVLADLRERAGEIESRERALREREREVERESRREARRYLLQARQEVELVIGEIRREVAGADDSARDARRRVETLAAEQAEALDELERPANGEPSRQASPSAIEAGSTVEVGTLGGRAGQVVEIRGEDAVVALGSLKVTVPIATLRATRRQTPAAAQAVVLRGDLPEERVETEVDLRGMRVDEMERALMAFIDTAVRSDLRSARVIHGKGTGALRDRVAELLRGDPRVESHRLALWNEGGTGATIVEFR